MSIFDRFLNKKPKASLDSVTFDTARYRYQGEAEVSGHGLRRRVTAAPPDFLFQAGPDLPPGTKSRLELQEFYRGRICSGGVEMVEFRLKPVAGIPSVWMILKFPRKPHGMVYLRSLTIPFAMFSYVLKMQCEERGLTGIREAAIFLDAQAEGGVILEAAEELMGNFNSDDARYDDQFPNHPLSRLRREFAFIAHTFADSGHHSK